MFNLNTIVSVMGVRVGVSNFWIWVNR